MIKRTKGKKNANLTLKDAYIFYINSIEPVKGIKGDITKGTYNVKETIYTAICKDFNEEITKKEILENLEFKIPHGGGSLSIRGYLPKYKLKEGTNKLSTKNLFPDWKRTKELWAVDEEARLAKTIIFHENKHTNGKRFKFFWSKKKVKIRNISLYQFISTRTNKRFLADCLKNEELQLNYFN